MHDAAWIERHARSARAIFARHGVDLVLGAVERFTPTTCDLLSRADRHAMARFVVDRPEVTVLVVRRVRDLDLPSYDLMGVHWRYQGKDPALAGRRWIFLTHRARPPVLAHELCHFFGLGHDRRGGNLMAPGPSDPVYRGPESQHPRPFRPRLEPWQARTLRRNIARDARQHRRAAGSYVPVQQHRR